MKAFDAKLYGLWFLSSSYNAKHAGLLEMSFWLAIDPGTQTC